MLRVDWTTVADTLARASNVVAAWAFGSAKEGEVRPGGDVDVAILFGEPPTLEERADLRADLQETLGIDDIDLVTLNSASPILQFEAVSGHQILCRDAQACAAFVSLAAREYEDANALAQRALGYWARGGAWQPLSGRRIDGSLNRWDEEVPLRPLVRGANRIWLSHSIWPPGRPRRPPGTPG